MRLKIKDMKTQRKEIDLELVKSLMDGKYCLIYVHHEDSLDNYPEVIGECIAKKSADPLYEFFDQWYGGSESCRVDEIVEELKMELTRLGYRKWEAEKFFDENEEDIRSEIYSRAESDGIDDLLRNTGEMPVRIEMLSNYDCINSHWLESSGGYCYEESYFGDMVDALNLNPRKVKQILVARGDKALGRFPNLKSRNGREQVSYEHFYQELENSTCGANLLTYAATVDVTELFESDFNLSKITIPKGNYCGIFSSMQGGGSVLEMELQRDVVIDLTGNKNYPGYRLRIEVHGRQSHEYTINEVYGVLSSFYGKQIQIQTLPDKRLSA